MDQSKAQIKNAEQGEKFKALVVRVLVEIAEIDAGTVADPRWSFEPPAWWYAMSRLRDECYRAKARTV